MSADVLVSTIEAVKEVPKDNLGLVKDFAHKLSGNRQTEWAKEGSLFLRQEPSWSEPLVVKKFLSLVTTVMLPAQPRFVATEKFVVNTDDSAEVKIAFIWDDFKPFLGKVEEPTPETELAVYNLKRDLLDQEIRNEIGTKKEEITLSQFWAMLKRQGHGQEGTLLVNGRAIVAYIRDAKDVLWAVGADWDADDGGWGVNAYSVESPDRWDAGYQVLSRNYRIFSCSLSGGWEFLSNNPFFQPPNSRPISFSFSSSWAYCFGDSNLFSHEISENNFILSMAMVAFSIAIIFSVLGAYRIVPTSSISSISNASILFPKPSLSGLGNFL